MDFDWPMGEVWQGYLMPDRLREDPCPDCESGGTDAYEWLMKVAYVIVGLADDADAEERGRHMHPYLTPLLDISYGHPKGRPGRQFAEFANGLVNSDGFLGRDVHRFQRALIEAAGLPKDWGWCPTCKGHASIEKYPGQLAEAEAWEWTEPPTGDGWQMWETTSEGSPMSPVFATPEELAAWLASTGASAFGDMKLTRKQWLDNIVTGEPVMVTIAPGVVMM